MVHFDYEMIWKHNSRTSSTFVNVSFSELNSLFIFHWTIKKIYLKKDLNISNAILTHMHIIINSLELTNCRNPRDKVKCKR